MQCLSICLSVCLCVSLSVTFVDSVDTSKRIFKIFSPSGSQTILVSPYQMSRHIFDGDPLTWASNAGGVGRNRDSGPISIACCECLERRAIHSPAMDHGELMSRWYVVEFVDGGR